MNRGKFGLLGGVFLGGCAREGGRGKKGWSVLNGFRNCYLANEAPAIVRENVVILARVPIDSGANQFCRQG